MEQHDIMTVDEVAAYVRVSERTVYEWAQKGEIPCGKLGSTWRFRRSDVEEWVNKRLGGTTQPSSAPKKGSDMLGMLLKRENVIMLKGGSKDGALNALLDVLTGMPEVLNTQDLRKGIYHREELMSTGIGQGLGVPHVRLESVKNIVVALGVSREPIEDYTSLDGAPVHLVFMIAAGKNQHADHIRLLSSISMRFKDVEIRNAVLNAEGPDEVFDLIMKA